MKPTTEVLAWHFTDGDVLRDGRPVPPVGVPLIHGGPLEMCASGLHASVRLIDALRYAPGSRLHRVVCRGVEHGDDKLVCRERVILWSLDAEAVLREFARDCALDVLHLWATDDTPGIDTVVEYLLTGDESLRDAARDAAWAARAAARAAAWAARAAARDAARDAAAWADARADARDAQNARLERLAIAEKRTRRSEPKPQDTALGQDAGVAAPDSLNLGNDENTDNG